jgi:hypothetical protein
LQYENCMVDFFIFFRKTKKQPSDISNLGWNHDINRITTVLKVETDIVTSIPVTLSYVWCHTNREFSESVRSLILRISLGEINEKMSKLLITFIYHCEFESRNCEVYLIQHLVIKFVSDLRQVCGYLWHDLAEIVVKVALNNTTLTHKSQKCQKLIYKWMLSVISTMQFSYCKILHFDWDYFPIFRPENTCNICHWRLLNQQSINHFNLYLFSLIFQKLFICNLTELT